MNIQGVKELVDQFDKSSLREFDLRKGDFQMYLSKNEGGRVAAPTSVTVAPVAAAPVVATAPVASAPVAAAPVTDSAVGASTETDASTSTVVAEGEVITSPIVGTVYLSPAPDKPHFVQVGDSVSENDTLCIVEAMKMMNEIPAGQSGVITEILIENEQVVGIGDPLFRIK
ncbi:MAG: acetyl-CoA carboxylase biotin carboxyl carrier protein [Streptococcaceae bacterium]|nr:acetyl-CoA carboxylase biotin carboxyl carrier protein [Streptococcaceae bacterium]